MKNFKFVLFNKYYENDKTQNESAYMEEMRSEKECLVGKTE